MKSSFTVIFLSVFVLFYSSNVLAGIKSSELEKGVVLTQGATFLQQVDTVSLYLSSGYVAFAPRLTKAGQVKVETTIIDPALAADPVRMQDFISRLINTFVAVLKERLPNYAPGIAKKFNPDTDIVFIINAGAKRSPVGIWQAGSLQVGAEAVIQISTTATEESKAARQMNEARAEDAAPKTPKNCGCPARK